MGFAAWGPQLVFAPSLDMARVDEREAVLVTSWAVARCVLALEAWVLLGLGRR